MTSAPSFVGTPKAWTGSIGNNSTLGAWTFLRDNVGVGAGSLGSKITSITAINTDTTARAISVALLRGVSQTGAAGISTANVTTTFASPGVLTLAGPGPVGLTHNLTPGDQLVFTGTFNASANIVQGNTLFVVAGGLTGTAFEVAYTAGGTALNSGSGTWAGVVMYNVKVLGSVTLATAAGSDGANSGTNILGNALLPGIPVDNDGQPYLFLESTDYLAVTGVTNLPAANKIVSVTATGGNF
jgi:hypothetical protein